MILIEDGPGGGLALFDGAEALIVARAAGDVAPALAALDAARAQGKWVAGYIGYEAGYALEPKLAGLMPPDTVLPLLVFGVFAGPSDPAEVLARANAEARGVVVAALEPAISRADYGLAMESVMAYIAAGDCYQINLTFPLRTRLLHGSALGLYGALRARQAVGHGSFVDLGVGPVLVSRSPELFVRIDASGRIEARPMKGTAPRDADPVRDAELAEELRGSAKGQAENLMIVDLLRNDISRVAKVGSVKVPELFAVESYATLHQMVSRVVGQLVEAPSMAGVMTALFPCGSITGAPKIRAMQIIREVEPFARGAYCGAIGWMAPDGAASFSVAIRTLSVFEGGEITLNVGGGVVQDSTTEGEWEEALWKARYVQGLVRRD
ncbi:MAG: para-aminobenzoate synthetase component [Cypionkella sp.]|uniref:aminodeoxychorismate synthase component I n=1 Tax=Cypionkella sp. TaxID=2811411 RepID=UPI00261F6281|nr:aminodeoxychorismate synthase component I [Cypionkella sp.]MDB5659143.1 para-aminobenzoate synthetase component [Cypionkella sp.]